MLYLNIFKEKRSFSFFTGQQSWPDMIVVDDREQLTDSQKSKLGSYITKHLDLGDFLITDDNCDKIYCIYERKSYADLVASINDKRLIKQINECCDLNNKIFKLAITRDSTPYPDKAIATARSICLGYGIEMQKFSSKDEFLTELIEMNEAIAKRRNHHGDFVVGGGSFETKDSSNSSSDELDFILLNSLKTKKKDVTRDNFLSVVLSVIPGISTKTAILIANYYKGDPMNCIQHIVEDIPELEKMLTKRVMNSKVKQGLIDMLK